MPVRIQLMNRILLHYHSRIGIRYVVGQDVITDAVHNLIHDHRCWHAVLSAL